MKNLRKIIFYNKNILINRTILLSIPLSLLLMTSIIIAQSKIKISQKIVGKICLEEYIKLNVDTNKIYVTVYPEHPISLDSIKRGRVGRPFWGKYSEWLGRTEGRLNKKTFWKCRLSEEYTLDGFTVFYVDSKTGEVLYMEGMGSHVTMWRKNNGFKKIKF